MVIYVRKIPEGISAAASIYDMRTERYTYIHGYPGLKAKALSFQDAGDTTFPVNVPSVWKQKIENSSTYCDVGLYINSTKKTYYRTSSTTYVENSYGGGTNHRFNSASDEVSWRVWTWDTSYAAYIKDVYIRIWMDKSTGSFWNVTDCPAILEFYIEPPVPADDERIDEIMAFRGIKIKRSTDGANASPVVGVMVDVDRGIIQIMVDHNFSDRLGEVEDFLRNYRRLSKHMLAYGSPRLGIPDSLLQLKEEKMIDDLPDRIIRP